MGYGQQGGRQLLALALVDADGVVTVAQIADTVFPFNDRNPYINCPRKQAGGLMGVLVRDGYVTKVSKGVYQITQQGRQALERGQAL